jgi:hypothetical protein
MEIEVKEKLEVTKKNNSNTTGITLEGIPLLVHKKLQQYQLRISSQRRRKFTIKEAYIDWLKESTKKL